MLFPVQVNPDYILSAPLKAVEERRCPNNTNSPGCSGPNATPVCKAIADNTIYGGAEKLLGGTCGSVVTAWPLCKASAGSRAGGEQRAQQTRQAARSGATMQCMFLSGLCRGPLQARQGRRDARISSPSPPLPPLPLSLCPPPHPIPDTRTHTIVHACVCVWVGGQAGGGRGRAGSR